jgi:hypothetical protein
MDPLFIILTIVAVALGYAILEIIWKGKSK